MLRAWEGTPADLNSPRQYKVHRVQTETKPTPRREVKGYKCDQELLESGWRAALEVAVADDGTGAAGEYTVWIVREAKELCTDFTSRSRGGDTAGCTGCRRGGVWGCRGWNASCGKTGG